MKLFSFRKKLSLGFTLVELIIVMAILGIMATLVAGNYLTSARRSRDARRKSDLSMISKALEMYYNDYGQYPLASAGRIAGCGAGGTGACVWGTSAFSNTTTGVVYMKKMPKDPGTYSYLYTTTGGTNYQLYARLEYTQDKDAFSPATGNCGSANSCTYVISSSN